jgi:hypothetical protein
VGHVTVIVIVDPGVQLEVVKSKSPWGKAAGAPAGGLAGSPLTRMNCRTVNVHDGPPPVKLALIVPVPVADGAVYAVATGITGTVVEAAPVPVAFVAATEHV